MASYRKLFVAIIGLVVLIYGGDLVPAEMAAANFFDEAVALLTAVGVWAFRNEPLT